MMKRLVFQLNQQSFLSYTSNDKFRKYKVVMKHFTNGTEFSCIEIKTDKK
ncbi:hypothetical protein [Flavobacterium anhuiense]|nr:hypothetical protein [Flavobacterium anhuiense]